jgi:phage shock protein A
MGLFSRLTTLFKAKMSKLLDNAEDPRETLDYSYEKQLELLQQVKRGIVEVTTSKKRLELQAGRIEGDLNKADEQARRAITAGREDLARIVLQRKTSAQQQLDGLDTQIQGLDLEQQKLMDAEQRLTAKVEAFRTRKEVIKAQYSAAEAQVKIGEAVSGISEEMTDIGLAIDRAENKTQELQARAGAIDELVQSGVLSDYSELGSGTSSSVDRELDKLGADASVEAELAKLKQELGAGTPPNQLSAGSGS